MTIDYRQLEKGLQVWCLLYGAGTITRFDPSRIWVTFEDQPNITEASYDLDGLIRSYSSHDYGVGEEIAYVEGDTNRMLYFSEPSVAADELPTWRPTMREGEEYFAKSKRGLDRVYFIRVIEEHEAFVHCTVSGNHYNLLKSEYEFYKGVKHA